MSNTIPIKNISIEEMILNSKLLLWLILLVRGFWKNDRMQNIPATDNK